MKKDLEQEIKYIGCGNDSKAFKVIGEDLYYRGPNEKDYFLLKRDFRKTRDS